MGVVEIIALIAALVNASRDILLNINQLGDLLKTMNDEGRTDLTPEEMAKLVAMRDQARKALQDAIDNAP